MEQMDFQSTATEYVTETQAIGDEKVNLEYDLPQLPLPLSADHAALHSDFKIITIAAMERLYHRITEDVNKTTALAIKKSNDQLHNQIALMGARIFQLQQQVLTYQGLAQHTDQVLVVSPISGKKESRKKKENHGGNLNMMTTAGHNSITYAAVATAAVENLTIPTKTTNKAGWTTLKVGGQKDKKIPTSKLIPTTYL
jgi:hypothetical protein